MRICFVNSLYGPNAVGGAEATLKGLAEALAMRGWGVDVIALTPGRKAYQERLGGVNVYYLPSPTVMWPFDLEQPVWRKLLFQLLEAWNPLSEGRIKRLVTRLRPDLVHVHNFKGLSALSVWRGVSSTQTPVVQTLHDYTLVCPRSVMFKRGADCRTICWNCKLLSAPRRMSSCQPEAFTAVSERMVERMRGAGAHIPADRLSIIRGENPVPAGGPPAKLPGEPLTLGFLGRLDPIKGVEVAIKAVRQAPDLALRFLIGGAGAAGYQDELQRLAQGDSRIVFRGQVKASDFFRSIDVLIVPSLWEEPLGRVVHEAFSYGVPVVASATGGIPEILQQDVNGLLFQPGDVDGLATLLREVVTESTRLTPLSEGALQCASQFEANKIHDQYEDLLLKLAKGHPAKDVLGAAKRVSSHKTRSTHS